MSLFDLVAELGAKPSPCQEYKCRKAPDCAAQKLACGAFRYFVNTGRSVNPRYEYPLRVTMRQRPVYVEDGPFPTRDIFDQIEPSEDCARGDANAVVEAALANEPQGLRAWVIGKMEPVTDEQLAQWIEEEAQVAAEQAA